MITTFLTSGTFIYLFTPFFKPQAEAAWYDDNWHYRKSVEITAHTAQETNEYIAFTIANTNTLVTAGKLQSDCGDLRFTDMGGNLLSYFIVSGCNSASTVVHVNFQVFPAGAQTIYYYYGNPSAQNGAAAADFSTEASSYTVGSQGSEEKAQSPAGYWKFNEGTGTAAKDTSSNEYNGTVTSATWQTEDQCISSKCLYFDGTVASVDTNHDFSWTNADPFTISVWVRPNTNTADHGILGKVNWEYSLLQNDNTFKFNYYNTVGAGVIDLDSNTLITVGKWYHIEITSDGTTATMYVNGKVEDTDTNITGTYQDRAEDTIVGRAYTNHGSGAGASYFQGFIDEPKIYDYARSAEQAKLDYNVQGASVLGVQAGENLDNGLIGYWKMDENTGTTTVADSSGNNNTGTSASSANVTTGKFGNARSFNSTYVTIPDATNLNPTTAVTLSAWVNPTSTFTSSFRQVINKSLTTGGGDRQYYMDIEVTSGAVRMCIQITCAISTTTLSADTWYHVIGTYDNTSIKIYVNGVLETTQAYTTAIPVTAGDLAIGRFGSISTNTFLGNIDEARVYNRAIDSQEASQLYNWGPDPIMYYNFEEGSGTTINDTSGSGYNGTLSNSPTRTAGKFGQGLQFTQSSTQQASTSVSSGPISYLSNHTLGFWVKFTNNAASDWRRVTGYQITAGSDRAPGIWTCPSGNSTLGLYWRFAPSNSGFSCYGPTGASSVFSTNTWYYVAVSKNGSTATYYVNGVAYGTATVDNPMSIGTGAWDIGHINSTYTAAGVIIDEMKLYNYPRTAQQIIQDMNGSGAPGGSSDSAVGKWQFDEGYGTTTANNGNLGSTLDGTISGATWTNSGKYNKALVYDGTDDSTSLPDNDAIDFSVNQNFSVSFWVKDGGGNSNADSIVEKWTGAGGYPYVFRFNTTGNTVSFARWDGTNNPTVLGGVSILDGNWHHVVGIKDGSILRIYIDGKQRSTTPDTTTGTTTNSSPIYIASRGGASLFYNGTVDELNVYGYALTAQEVAMDYNQNSSQVLGAVGTAADGTTPSNDSDRGYCPPGDTTATCAPVAEWLFEEGSGTTVNDTSTGGNTGTFAGSSTYWANGQNGKVGNFQVDNYVSATSVNYNLGNSLTISAWVKPNVTANASTRMTIFSNNEAASMPQLELGGSAGTNRVAIIIPGVFVAQTGDNAVTTGQWNHIVYTRNGTGAGTHRIYVNGKNITLVTDAANDFTNAATTIQIGRRATSQYFNGQIDQVRLFNYPLSASQVAWTYNQGKPVGFWSFDECQGTVAKDLSTSQNTGTITIGASGSQTTTGTCLTPTDGTGAWYNGRNGKVNSSLNFDGTDDYVEVPMTIAFPNVTTAAWIKTTDANAMIIERSNTSFYFALISGQVCMYLATASPVWTCSTTTVHDGNWHHVVGSYDGVTKSIYIDGKLSNSISASGSVGSGGAAALQIGNRNNSGTRIDFFAGQIDEPKVFNYGLSPIQVKTLFNNGAINFAPITGTP